MKNIIPIKWFDYDDNQFKYYLLLKCFSVDVKITKIYFVCYLFANKIDLFKSARKATTKIGFPKLDKTEKEISVIWQNL